MKVNIQSMGFTASRTLLSFVEQKVNKLLRFEEQIEYCEAILREENSPEGNNQAEIRLKLRHGEVFASKQGASYEEAVDKTVDALRRQLLKLKEKKRS